MSSIDERVNEDILVRRRELDEAGASAIGVQAVGFGIAGDALLALQRLDQMLKIALVVDSGCRW